MAGTTLYVRGTGDEQSALDQAVTILNQLTVEIDAFVAAFNAANGGAIVAASSIANRLRLVAEVTAAFPTGSSTLTKDSGDSQTAVVAVAVTDALVVEALDGSGNPLVNATIRWTPADDTTTLAATTVTDADGLSSVTVIAGHVSGTKAILAELLDGVGSVVDSVSFTLTQSPGAAAIVNLNAGDNQQALTSAAVAILPSVIVYDTYGNLVADGTAVVFAVASGGGSRTGGSATTTSGIATVGSWTLGASAGTNTLTATSNSIVYTFTASAVAAAATQIDISAGGTQSPIAGAATTTITFRVRDVTNTAVQGVLVTFDPSLVIGGGTMGTPSNSGVSDASGLVTMTITTNVLVGLNSFVGSILGGSVAVTFSCTTVAGTATKILVVTQPASSAVSGVTLTQQPVFEVTDANGNRKLTGTGSAASVTLAKGSGAGTFHGTSPVVAVSGLISPTDINFTGAGSIDTITASCGSPSLTSATTAAITLADPIAVAGQLQEPITGVLTGVPKTIKGNVVDGSNVIVSTDTRACTLVKASGPGTVTAAGVNAVAGVATFSATFDTAGDYTLTFTPNGLTPDVSATITVTVAPASNEPMGYSAVTTRDFAAIVEASWLNTATADLAIVTPDGANGTTLDSMASQFLRSSTATGRAKFQNVPGGTAPSVNIAKSFSGGSTGIYLDFDFAISDPWVYNPVVNKILFLCAGGSPNAPIVIGLSGAGKLQTRTQGTADSPTAINYDMGPILTKGQKYRIEVVYIMNTNGVADGVLQCWVDGVAQTINATNASGHNGTNCKFRGSATIPGSATWDKVKWNPTYGGGAPDSPSTPQYQYIGYLYLSRS